MIDIGDRGGEDGGQHVFLNSLWVYDRVLTEDEVMKNYLLDLEKFGSRKREE